MIIALVVIVATAASNPKSSSTNAVDSEGSTDNTSIDRVPPSPNDSTIDPITIVDDSTTTTTFQNTTVYFIDVGQGDAQLIQTSDGKNILFDAGPKGASGTVVSFLQSHNATTLDAFIVTHPHDDHIGGGEDVLRHCTVRSIYQTGQTMDTGIYNEFETAVRMEDCPIYTGATLKPGDLLNLSNNVTFMLMAMDSSYEDMNDASLVIKMTDGTVDFLLMGDATEAVEELMDRTYGSAMDVDILKVGHHGSRWSTGITFLGETTPSIAVIEVGRDNNYGHPTNGTLDRLGAIDAQVYRTDLNGSIEITTDGTNWMVSTKK